MRAVPVQALALARAFEGFSAEVYLCPAGLPTIGFGHVCRPDHPRITRAEGELLLRADMAHAMRQALRLCPVLLAESDERVAAVCDFVFNLGATRLAASTLRKRINAGRWDEAEKEMLRWVWAGGRRLNGLVRRRNAAALLLRVPAGAGLREAA